MRVENPLKYRGRNENQKKKKERIKDPTPLPVSTDPRKMLEAFLEVVKTVEEEALSIPAKTKLVIAIEKNGRTETMDAEYEKAAPIVKNIIQEAGYDLQEIKENNDEGWAITNNRISFRSENMGGMEIWLKQKNNILELKKEAMGLIQKNAPSVRLSLMQIETDKENISLRAVGGK